MYKYIYVDPILTLLINFSTALNNVSDNIPTKNWDHICLWNANTNIDHSNVYGLQDSIFRVFDSSIISFKCNLNISSL